MAERNLVGLLGACFLMLLLAFVGVALLGLSTLPKTGHAAANEGHETQAYNTSKLLPIFDNGGCKPKSAYICTGEQVGIALCGIKPGLTGGIVVGWRGGVSQVITGFASDQKYWDRNIARRGCVQIPYWLFGVALVAMPIISRMFARKQKLNY